MKFISSDPCHPGPYEIASNELQGNCYPLSDPSAITVILFTGTTNICRRTTSTTANTRNSEPASEKLTTTPSKSASGASALNTSSELGRKTSEIRNRTLSPSRV